MIGHDIAIRPAPGTVRVLVGGELVAQSEDALLLEETGSPPRYYLPREDVLAELLPSEHHTFCPFKGQASYHSVGEHRDVVWFYPEPKERVAAIRDRVAFWGERTEILVG